MKIGHTVRVAAAACCAWLAACHAPPFSVPQPEPDWSDPEKQWKASVEVIACEEVVPWHAPAGCWLLRLRTRVVGNSREAAESTSFGVFNSISDVAPWTATLREVGGPLLQLREPQRPWIVFPPAIRPMVSFEMPDSPRQLPSGDWEVFGPAAILVERAPVGDVELAIDGEALRDAMTRRRELRECPVGGLTGTVSVFRVPAAMPDQCVNPYQPGDAIFVLLEPKSCELLQPNWKPPRWTIGVDVTVKGPSEALVLQVGNRIRALISTDPARFAWARDAIAATLPLAGPGSSWVHQFDRETEFVPTVHPRRFTAADLKRVYENWALTVPITLVSQRRPLETLVVGFHDEELRQALEASRRTTDISIAPGAFIAWPETLKLPEPTPAAPPLDGPGLTIGSDRR